MKKFSQNLQHKIDCAKEKMTPIKLGNIQFDSPLLLAPMASICNAPYRLLMEELGAGGTVSELISCHGILHGNKKTMDMLYIHPDEKNIGIQLFGEDADSMAQAAQVAEKFNPKFIDINMGCPVRKVVTKGGGSALMRDIETLGPFFNKVKKAIKVPLTIKIRMGWNADEINADKICNIAYNEGVEFVAVHGRTRAQQYTGEADWKYIEWLSDQVKLPLIGNGDLHQPFQVWNRSQTTNCDALMIARGALRNPFIFLEALNEPTESSIFTGEDYWEVIQRLHDYTLQCFDNERTRLVQLRKLIVWFAAGFSNVAKFRGIIFSTQGLDDCMKVSEDFFLSLTRQSKNINYNETFMTSGHG